MAAPTIMVLLLALTILHMHTACAGVGAQEEALQTYTTTKLPCKPAWLQLEKYDTYTGVVSTWHHSVVHTRLKSEWVHLRVGFCVPRRELICSNTFFHTVIFCRLFACQGRSYC